MVSKAVEQQERETMNSLAAGMIVAALAAGSWHCGLDAAGVVGTATDAGKNGTSGRSTYAYAGYDSSGREIVRGELVIIVDDSGAVTGSWDLAAVGTPPPMIGPQVGTGTLEGRIVLTAFGANLNPDMVDNNVVLMGTVSSTGIAGIWEFIGFPGVLNEGTFIAWRRE
jgi:hypothetical protein